MGAKAALPQSEERVASCRKYTPIMSGQQNPYKPPKYP
jgi:hypothetical protein